MSLGELLPTLRAWQDDGAGIGRATLVRAFHSSPRSPGAVLLAADDGRIAGSVSGGCVEGAAAEEVRRARRDGRSRVIRYGISDDLAWDVGLACGGIIDVLVEPEIRAEAVAAAEAAATGSQGGALLVRLPADAPGDDLVPTETGVGEPPAPALLVRSPDEAPADLQDAARAALTDNVSSVTRDDRDRQWFVEAFGAPPRLVVVGAVHVALPLLRFARELGYRTVLIDRRATYASAERTGDADEMHLSWPDDAFVTIGLHRGDSVAILSHDAKLDEPAIVGALRAGCRYVGAIGSRKTQAERRDRLLAAGVTVGELARLHGPIGLDLGGRAPAEVALAVMAEIIGDRHNASGGPTPRQFVSP
ncbi:MAG: XdhC family protein [Candidatus Limnocylindria bacterium]